MAAPVVVDLRNVYRPEEMRQRGFAYTSGGRPSPASAFIDGASLDRPLLLAKERASASG